VAVPESLEGPVENAVLWQAIRMYLANQRQGTADTKRRGEVRGGGKKPWKQKHTGRARQGSIRSPLWRKGGIVFGPHPREYRYHLPDRLLRKALVASLRVRHRDGAVVAVDTLDLLTPKTKAFSHFLKQIHATEGALLVVDQPSPLLSRACRNIPRVQVKPVSDLTCYDVLNHSKLVITTAGLKRLEVLGGGLLS
jgi:large subunit ribosomal protein L4